jgi:hypothetical protein
MEGKDTFQFVKENEFPVSEWRKVIQVYPRLLAAPSASGKEENRGKAKEDRERAEAAAREADAWAARNFPDDKAMIKASQVEVKLASFGEETGLVTEILRRTSNFGSFVFIVDLTGQKPVFPPGALGFALGKKEYYFNFMGEALRQPLPKDTSMVVNDQTLERWRKMVIWQKAPLVVLILLLVTLALLALQALGGSLVAAVSLSFFRCSLPFSRIFSLSIYAIIPPLILIWIFWLLHLGPFLLLGVYALIYAIYLIGAAKNCCQLD